MKSRARFSEPLRIIDGHLLVEREGGLAILDTGVPSSMPCPPVVSEVLGVPVDRLIGCAELAEAPIEIDWPGRRLVHGATPRAAAVSVPLTPAAFGIPCIDVETPTGAARAILDTGAALSYAPPEAVAGLAPVRQATDFLPGYGRFTVDVYRLDLTIGGVALSVECGVLPPLLRMALALLCPSGWILGSALFRDRIVTLDLAGRLLYMSPVSAPSAADDPLGDAEDDDIPGGPTQDVPPVATGREGNVEYVVRVDAVQRSDAAVHLRAAITLRGVAAERERPVQLALVVDRSGSMAGGRLASVREAARAVARQLPAGSEVGLVTYAGTATTDVPLASADAPGALAATEAVLERLQAGGATALADGWRAGCDLLSEPVHELSLAFRPGALRRVLLLSDGRANVGERSPVALARRCADAAGRGVTTSTVGIGAGYDEDLLRSMAVAGSGNTWYVATPEQATAVLEEELHAMRSLVALGATVRVTPSSEAEVTGLYGGIIDPRMPDPTSNASAHVLRLGELSAAVERTVVVEYVVRNASEGDGARSLGTVHLSAHSLDDGAAIEITIPLAWSGQVAADAIARLEWLRLRIAAARLDAVRLADAGRHARAVSRLREEIERCERQPNSVVHALARPLGELRRLARQLERSEFTPTMRKETLQRADNVMTGKLRYDGWLRRGA